MRGSIYRLNTISRHDRSLTIGYQYNIKPIINNRLSIQYTTIPLSSSYFGLFLGGLQKIKTHHIKPLGMNPNLLLQYYIYHDMLLIYGPPNYKCPFSFQKSGNITISGSSHLVPKENHPSKQKNTLPERLHCMCVLNVCLLAGYIIGLASREILCASAVKVLAITICVHRCVSCARTQVIFARDFWQ